jgi:hypothetical protein
MATMKQYALRIKLSDGRHSYLSKHYKPIGGADGRYYGWTDDPHWVSEKQIKNYIRQYRDVWQPNFFQAAEIVELTLTTTSKFV